MTLKLFRAVALAVAIATMSVTAFAASEWEGVWKVKDTAGQPFEITLAADGKATASLHEAMTGTWKAEGPSAVITWKTGWTTKISKAGAGYKKTGYRAGAPLDGAPSNSSDAVKAK